MKSRHQTLIDFKLQGSQGQAGPLAALPVCAWLEAGFWDALTECMKHVKGRETALRNKSALLRDSGFSLTADKVSVNGAALLEGNMSRTQGWDHPYVAPPMIPRAFSLDSYSD